MKRLMNGLLLVGMSCHATGAGAANCSLGFTATPQAVLLPVTTVSAQRVQVGTVSQNCNGTISYVLVVASADCVASPAGAKLQDPTSREFVAYSVEFSNPYAYGGPLSVTGLLANACANAVGRDVNFAKVNHEDSAVFINFTGVSSLAAGTYSDTLSVTLNVN